MNIYPAMDLKAGACVRLYQGCYQQVTVYSSDPLARAQAFAAEGAEALHVVDLDGAKTGELQNRAVILTIARETGLLIQCGGGIRTKKQVEEALQAGIHRVVLGSQAIREPVAVKTWIEAFGAERIVVALDVRLDEQAVPRLAVEGWQVNSDQSLWQLLEEYQDSALKHVICTDISRDGTLVGPNLDLYRECLKRFPQYQFQASGGVNSLACLQDLAALPVAGVILGKALYENKVTLPAVLREVNAC